MANFNILTRYTNGKIAKNRTEKSFLTLRNSLSLKEDETDTFFTIREDILFRPDLISFRAYGRPDLWWVIYEFNEIQDPLTQLSIGQILRIPGLEKVVTAIKNL